MASETVQQNQSGELAHQTQERRDFRSPTVGRGGTPTTHGRCGQKWRQRGNETGHCSGCHRNFDGSVAFDHHQTIEDGRNVCHDPSANPWYVARTDDLATYYGRA